MLGYSSNATQVFGCFVGLQFGQDTRTDTQVLYRWSTLGFNPVTSILGVSAAPHKTVFSADDTRTMTTSVLHTQTTIKFLHRSTAQDDESQTKDSSIRVKWSVSLKAENSASLFKSFQVPSYEHHLFTSLGEVLRPRCCHVLLFDPEVTMDWSSPGSSSISNQETPQIFLKSELSVSCSS